MSHDMTKLHWIYVLKHIFLRRKYWPYLFYTNKIISDSKEEAKAEDSKSNEKLYKIKKPWNVCLAVNKKKWKVQAVRGNLNMDNMDNIVYVLNFEQKYIP